jgi:putative spermidine/putrescine transport system permease protein
MSGRREPWRWALAAPPLVVSVALFLGPLAYLFYISLHETSESELYGAWGLASYVAIATDPFYLVIIRRTLGTALAVLACSLVIGYPVALWIAGLSARARSLALLALLFPLMVSNVVRAYGWVAILGRRGVINTGLGALDLIDAPLGLLYSPEAVVLGLLTILLPYMVISIANVLATLDPRYAEAAQALGAGPFRTFLHVTLPLSAPGVASGLLLVFLLTLSAYVTIAVLGGPQSKLLVSLVYDSVVSFHWPQAAALAFTLLAIALGVSGAILAVVRPGRVQGGRR